MAQVKIGEVVVGTLHHNEHLDMWTSSRSSGGGFVIVGSGKTSQQALTLLGRSLVSKADEEGSLSAGQRHKLRDLLTQLDAMGLSELSKAITQVLK